MKRFLPLAVAAAMGLAFAPAPTSLDGSAEQREDIELARTVSVDRTTGVEWTSDMFVGVAPNFFAGSTTGTEYECNDTVEGNCEYSLVEFVGISADELAQAEANGTLDEVSAVISYRMGITNYLVPASDLDIILWESNADGEKLGEIGRVGELDTDPSEEYQGTLLFDADEPVQYILLEVVYFAGAGTYDGYVNVSGALRDLD